MRKRVHKGDALFCGWELVLGQVAIPASSGANTDLQPRFGLRVRNRDPHRPAGWFWGRELTVWGQYVPQGTATVAVDRTLLGIDGRIVGGRSWGNRLLQIAPYAIAQLGGSVGWIHLHAGADTRMRPLAALAFGMGGGLAYELGPVGMRTEITLGTRNEVFELMWGVSLGWGAAAVRERDQEVPGGDSDMAHEPWDTDIGLPAGACLAW